MQDKDSEALRNQRRRRKRIARMKHTIIAIIAGWIILSMILIIFLLVRTRSMERKLDELWQMQRVMNQQVPDTGTTPGRDQRHGYGDSGCDGTCIRDRRDRQSGTGWRCT